MVGDTDTVAYTDNSASTREFVLHEFTGAGYDKGRSVVVQILWLSTQPVISQWWVPNRIRILVLRAFGARVGRGVLIRHGVRIHWPWKLTVGDDSWIGERVWILNLEPVTIGGNTCVSQDVLLCTGSHDRKSPSFEFDNAPISVGDSAWIATRATVLRGVTIGDRSVIGAASLVVKDVPDGVVVMTPAAEEVHW
ncbi:putative colanic acid biosynthesis acetyltransferase [Gordonia sp. NPDC003376]